MINPLIAALGLELDLSAEEIADVIWLATQMQQSVPLRSRADPPAEAAPQPSTPAREKPFIPPKSRSEQKPQEPQGEIVPQGSRSPNLGRSQELAFQVPDVRSLREPLTLARSLRPLLRRIATGNSTVLNEAATIQRIVEEQLWIPVLQPSLEPWLDLALVVDESDSMLIWRRTVTELQRLLENYGVFRTVRVWGLVEAADRVQIRPGFGVSARRQRRHSPSELIDPTGRCLVLVVSDCVAPLWQSGRVLPALKAWSQCGAMAIVQMLPEWLWRRTALGLATAVQLRALAPGLPNQQLTVSASESWDEADLETGIKVPVITLEPELFATWTQVVAGRGGVWTPGVVFEPSFAAMEEEDDRPSSDLTAEQRVQRFRLTASPMARRLAGLLAAAPVISLPIVRIVQDRLLNQSRQVHLAEVFLGGLLKPLGAIALDTNPDRVQYDFFEGVREVLLESLPLPDSVDVLDAVSKFVASRMGLSLEAFAAVLRNPQQGQAGELAGQMRPFARVTAQVLKRMGGEYAKFAVELEGVDQGEWRSEHEFDQVSLRFQYYTGGAVPPDTSPYIVRQADRELYEALKARQYCAVSSPRQMGKSSLRIRAEQQLQAEGIIWITIDITNFSTAETTEEHWYWGLIHSISHPLELYETFELESWWSAHSTLSSPQKLKLFIEEVLLKSIAEPIVIFLEELDGLLSLKFNTDNFLFTLRDCYYSRAEKTDYERLTFVLLGLLPPVELIRSEQSISFEFARSIKLTHFQPAEAQPLAQGLVEKCDNPEAVLREILYWTSGQPFLTQKICSLVVQLNDLIRSGDEQPQIANLIQSRMIENWDSQEQAWHMRTVRDYVFRSDRHPTAEQLHLYQQILQAGEIDVDGSSAQRELCISGLVVQQAGKLHVANRIYAAVFNQIWIDSALRDSVSFETTNRRLLLRQGNTQLYALHTRSPWLLPFDALVIPVGSEGSFGSFGKAFRDFLEYPAVSLSRAINSSLSEQGDFIELAHPLVILLPPKVERRLPSIESVRDRYVICATVEGSRGPSSQGAGIATEAVVRVARERGFKQIVLPLLGTGNNGLPIEDVAIAMLNAVEAALKTPVSNEIEEITFVSSSAETIALLERLVPQLDEHELSRSGNNTSSTSLHFPEEALSIDSPFYIERVPVERVCCEAITRRGALIRIKAPGYKGKTSLLTRILHYAESQNYRAISINFQLSDSGTLVNLDRFLEWFCCRITDELNLPDRVAELWTRPLLSIRQKCNTYIQRHILAELDCPLVLAIDSFDALFQSPDLVEGFASLLRNWHERGKNSPGWEKLRVVISHRQEIYTALNVNQSPFNVGLLIELPDFTQVQVQELASRYGLQWSEQQVKQLMDMVGGHPFLVQLAFCAVKNRKATLNSILGSPLAHNGIYNDYLEGCLNYIQYSQELAATLTSVVSANHPIEINQEHRFKLESMGVIHSQGNRATPANNLYRLYFRDRLQ
jgi:AAA-like domain